MTATTLCPKCTQPVGLPDHLDPAAEVRCPLCEAQYTLAEVMAGDAPSLIVLSAPAAASQNGDLSAALEEAVTDDAAAAVGPPQASVEEDFEQWDLSSVGDGETPSQATAEEVEEETEPGLAGGDEEISWETAADATAETAEDASSNGMDTMVGTTVGAAKTAKKKKARGPGMGTQVGGIVVFGIIGLVMGYLILKWMKAPAADEIDRGIASVIPWWGPGGDAATNSGGDDSEGGIVDIGSALTDKAPEPRKPPVEKVQNDVFSEDEKPPAAPHVRPVETPPAEVPFSGPLTAQQVTPAELGTALAAAMSEVSKKAKEVSAGEFKALCELGHAVAVVEDPSGPQSDELRRSASVLLRQASAPGRRGKIGVYGHAWIFDHRRQRPGVWIIGEVEKVETFKTPKGNLVETVLAVRGKDQTAHISAFSVERPDYRVGETAGILGTIVNDPAKRLTWYTGSRPIVVLSGVAIGLPN